MWLMLYVCLCVCVCVADNVMHRVGYLRADLSRKKDFSPTGGFYVTDQLAVAKDWIEKHRKSCESLVRNPWEQGAVLVFDVPAEWPCDPFTKAGMSLETPATSRFQKVVAACRSGNLYVANRVLEEEGMASDFRHGPIARKKGRGWTEDTIDVMRRTENGKEYVCWQGCIVSQLLLNGFQAKLKAVLLQGVGQW